MICEYIILRRGISERMEINIDKINTTLENFVHDRDWTQYHTPKNLAIALSVEASELLEHFQWRENESNNCVKENKNLMAKIEEEIADVAIYLARLSSVLDIDLNNVINKKLLLNEEKYPVSLSKGEFVKYSDR